MNQDSQKKFPDGFLWGAATASFQVEGGIENVDWAEAARKGKVPMAGRACEHYTRYAQDFDIAKSLGHNAHRFSIEWARVEPQEGVFDEEAIVHYKDVVRALRVRGIEPFITLWHFTQPDWFVKKGGFENPEASKIFARYCAKIAKEFREISLYYMTINEPYVWAGNGYNQAKWPPFEKNFLRFFNLGAKLARCHVAAYRAMKEVAPRTMIGVAKNNMYFHGSGILANFKAKILNWFWNERFLNAVERARAQDFIGLNYYMHKDFSAGPNLQNSQIEKNDMGWDIYPEGLYHVLLGLKKYNRPIYITENGLADAKDTKRAAFIRSHLTEAHRAIEGGVNLKGYFHWSLLDNYEWAEGFTKRFGLVEINYDTMERMIRPSARVYEKIARENAL